MNKILPAATGLAAALVLAVLTPTWSYATAKVDSQSPCSGSGNFSITLGFDSGTQKPTVSAASNSTCVVGGSTIAFVSSSLPAGMSWSITFPAPSAGGSVLANSCTFGSGSGQSSSCTVITSPPSGDYYYTVTLTSGGNSYVLDPKVIISGVGTPRHHRKKKSASATTDSSS